MTIWHEAASLPRLEKDTVHLWLVDVNQRPEAVAAWESVLSGDEMHRAASRHSKLEARSHVAGWGFLRELLGRELGRDPRELRFDTEPRGRPVLAGGVSSANIQFNLSYSGERVALALARDRRVGVDLERAVEMDYGAIVETQFSDEEIAQWREIPVELRGSVFYEAWTRKEAYVKALGDGLYRPMNSFAVEFRPRRPAAVVRCDRDPRAAERWCLHDFRPEAGYFLALAAEDPPVTILTASCGPHR